METIAIGIQNAALALAPAILTVAVLAAMAYGLFNLVKNFFDDLC